ncbi:MAG TPA: 16S rRNA (uracil(1498)-N(3))-methyltransferase [Planctomycetes bacterium]|nr:16S rRNA (uracil(1498)-N(3))-methyltransferase [Planctomycetaceae bacterium]HIN52881.1 16S rRNA (uracil(1498)-N(3))-methyltransferase [Planctomycetota bacterium]
MTQRYFLDTPIGQATSVLLQGSEAQHLTRVMRGKCGDRVELFDGSGWQWIAEIVDVGRNEATLKILSTEEADLEPALALTVGIALPKGDRQKWIIEKLVELGVTTVIPLTTSRGVAQPVDKALVRLRNHVISASKQCGRNRLLEIGEVASLEAFLQRTAENRFIAHPKSAQMGVNNTVAETPREQEACNISIRDIQLELGAAVVAIGPEGGFSAEEATAAAQLQWKIVDMGPRILRIETAALAFAARLLVGI